MNSLLDNTDEEQERPLHRGGEHKEITLGTTTILLIFFSLAVYGAVLFGFGYSLGSKHSGPVMAQQPTTSTIFGGLKPSPGSPAAASPQKVSEPDSTSEAAPAPAPPAPTSRTVTLPTANDTAEAAPAPTHPAPIVRQPPALAAPAPSPANAGPPPIPAAVPAGVPTVVVQVAAVSHAEDAEMIASTLRKRGYLVNIRTEADRLLHVQVGAFSNRKDAEAMRARLQADGFNAYIK